MLKDKIFHIIAKVLEMHPSEVNYETTPDTVDNWDSLRYLKIVIELESAFQIEIEEDAILEILSVKDIVEYISKKQNC